MKKDFTISDCISEIIVAAIFLVAFLYFNQYIAIYSKNLGRIPIFNSGIINVRNYLFVSIFAISVLKSILKMSFGHYNVMFGACIIITSIAWLYLANLIFGDAIIWNTQAINWLNDLSNLSLNIYFEKFMVIICAIEVIEIFFVSIKCLKAKGKNNG